MERRVCGADAAELRLSQHRSDPGVEREKIQIEEKIIQKDFQVPIQLTESHYQFAVSPKEINLVVEGTYGAIQA